MLSTQAPLQSAPHTWGFRAETSFFAHWAEMASSNANPVPIEPSRKTRPFLGTQPAQATAGEEFFSLFSSPPTMLLKTPLLHYATPSSFSYFHFPFISQLEPHQADTEEEEEQTPFFQEQLIASLALEEEPVLPSFPEAPFFTRGKAPSQQPVRAASSYTERTFEAISFPSVPSRKLSASSEQVWIPRTTAAPQNVPAVPRPSEYEDVDRFGSSPPSDNSDEESSQNDDPKKWSQGLPCETPAAKAAFKLFLRQFKKKEKEGGFESAHAFAKQQLSILPVSLHWKVCLELADLVKRENMVGEARQWYANVLQLQPAASQGWLEYAKLEEECGKLERCRELLMQGLVHCPGNESLLVKALKHEERMGNLKGARALLAKLKDEPLDKTWRTLLEGGLLEARAGNVQIAREVFKYLLKHAPWYGPVFNEAFRFEERYEEHHRATSIVEKGLAENPRYGPLWFSALRVYERQVEKGSTGAQETLRKTVERALAAVPKELVWKVHFETAQMEERAGEVERCRKAYALAAMYCPENLRWKVWIGGARTEVSVNNVEAARRLLKRAVDAAPRKARATVLLECSRLEEYLGNVDTARAILRKAHKETKHEWRVFLESVLLEIRAQNVDGAIEQAQEALRIHTGTGRLWAVLIHLYQLRGMPARQVEVFKEALQEVPKSGEVWCEGARIAMRRRNFQAARRYLDFAIQFTPQYGDSFIEYLALELMEHGPDHPTPLIEQLCINADPNYGFLWLQCKTHPLDSARHVLRLAREAMLGRFPTSTSSPGLGLSLSTLSLPPRPVGEESVSIRYPANLARFRMIYGGDPIKP